MMATGCTTCCGAVAREWFDVTDASYTKLLTLASTDAAAARGKLVVYANGLRNPYGIAKGNDGQIWVANNSGREDNHQHYVDTGGTRHIGTAVDVLDDDFSNDRHDQLFSSSSMLIMATACVPGVIWLLQPQERHWPTVRSLIQANGGAASVTMISSGASTPTSSGMVQMKGWLLMQLARRMMPIIRIAEEHPVVWGRTHRPMAWRRFP